VRGAARLISHEQMNDRYLLIGEQPLLFHVHSFVKMIAHWLMLTMNYLPARRVLVPFVDVQGITVIHHFMSHCGLLMHFWVLPH
jgi:hypothetical protein